MRRRLEQQVNDGFLGRECTTSTAGTDHVGKWGHTDQRVTFPERYVIILKTNTSVKVISYHVTSPDFALFVCRPEYKSKLWVLPRPVS